MIHPKGNNTQILVKAAYHQVSSTKISSDETRSNFHRYFLTGNSALL